jgi:glutamate racemase
MPDSSQPIGVFDSGLGGLTVAKELFAQLPAEDVIYFGDVGRYPYGPRSKEIITQFTRQDVNFLLEQQVKIIIAACNTASAVAVEEVQNEYDIKILGVIEPGARAAVAATQKGSIGIIGTTGTINSNAYAKAIERLNSGVKVFSLACPLFVPLVEEGYLDREASHLIAQDYLSPFLNNGVDTLVLGCTHYPLLKPVIRRVLGDGVKLIDSATETAREARDLLASGNLLRSGELVGTHKFYVSDIPDQFARTARHFLGREVNNVIRIDISKY